MSTIPFVPGTIGVHSVNREVEKEKLRQAACDLEGLFVEQMFQAMRQATPDNALTSGGSGEKMFREMMDRETAKTISSGPGLGIGAMVYRQLVEQAGLGDSVVVHAGKHLPETPKGGKLDANR